MRTAAPELWWVFVAAALAAGILTAAIVTSIVVQQRRYLTATRSFSGKLLAAQEEERARIARELHDDVIQRVALLGQSLDELAAFSHDGDRQFERRVRGLRAELVDFADEIRALAHRMHPPVLEHLGLPAALSTLAGEMWSTSHLRVGLDLDRSPVDMPPAVAAGLYRIAQESLRNVVKHAGASTAMVRLASADGGVQLVVEDDGHGFDTAAPRGMSGNGASGIGLTSITERARQFGGRVAVQSRPGTGTRVVAWIPLGTDAG
ncbi:MAG TPA: sensor histidine kinase [Gemmatimonadaceae bacterium]|nr:sensor histidine kinase [Gemmatimonadaceae bacterium]